MESKAIPLKTSSGVILFYIDIKVHHTRHSVLLMASILAFFLLAEHHCKCRLKSQSSGIHISFRMCQALKGYNWKVADDGSFNFRGLAVKLYTEELIDILCYDSTGCQEAG